LLLGKLKANANLERKRCTDGHENDGFDITTASMLKLTYDSKGYDVKNLSCFVQKKG